MAEAKRPHLEIWRSVRPEFSARVDRAAALQARHQRELLAQLDARVGPTADALRRIDEAVGRLEQAFERRWHGKQLKRVAAGKVTVDLKAHPLAPGPGQGAGDCADPTKAVADFVTSIGSASMPLTAGSRALRFDTEQATAIALVTRARNHQASLLRDLAEELVGLAPRVQDAMPGQRTAAADATKALQLPPGIGDWISTDLVEVRPGHGPLVVQCGWLYGGSGRVQVPAPSARTYWSSMEALDAELTGPVLWIPALLDLDRDGGLTTNSRGTVSSLLLRLLALLPAGQLKLQVFDPVRLGESVKYLFQLGDSAERIIGEKVGSTTKELRELLEATERHITYVTQKYLGANHKSLHEYNLAAGEVAEPYQVLALFDHPSGFDRPGSGTDSELVAQLNKIMQAGPRCGVYTVLHGEGGPPYLHALPGGPGSSTSGTWPHLMAPLLSGGTSRPMAQFANVNEMAGQVARGTTALAGATSGFSWVPAKPGADAPAGMQALMTRLERDLHNASGIEVSPERVAALAAQERSDRRSKGLPTGPVVAVPGDTATWWQGDSTNGVLARVGRQGSSSITELRLDSSVEHAHLLVGGKPGSGKSVFLHTLIGDLTRTYAPTELELYLLDIKFGVEFKAYETSPHARVVALESGREFGVSVLAGLETKMDSRSKKFKQAGFSKLDDFRPTASQPTPRIVAVIDEFHGLFETDDAMGNEAARLLRRLIKFGRAFGVHLVLASQTVSGAPLMPKDALGLIPQRVVFASSPDDSRLLLAEDNPEGALLDRPGEGIVNRNGGRRDSNTRFQATLTTREQAERQTRRLAAHARSRGLSLTPMVFDALAECALPTAAARAITAPPAGLQLAVPIGMPMGLGGAVAATLRRTIGGNLLVVAAPARIAPLATVVAALSLSGEVEVEVYDFHGAGSPLDQALAPVFAAAGARAGSGTVVALTAPKGRQIASGLEATARLVEQRNAMGDHRSRPRVLVLSGLEVAAELRPGSPAATALERILQDGPAVGVHVVVCVERMASAERTLGYGALDNFDVRVVGPTSRDESNRLIDEPIAVDLAPEQLALRDRAVPHPQVVRAFAPPPPSTWRP